MAAKRRKIGSKNAKQTRSRSIRSTQNLLIKSVLASSSVPPTYRSITLPLNDWAYAGLDGFASIDVSGQMDFCFKWLDSLTGKTYLIGVSANYYDSVELISTSTAVKYRGWIGIVAIPHLPMPRPTAPDEVPDFVFFSNTKSSTGYPIIGYFERTKTWSNLFNANRYLPYNIR